MILTVQVRDCARLRRIAYLRGRPFALPELDAIVVGSPTIHRFSAYLERAEDAWVADLVAGARATGTVGGSSLLVTYGKLGHVAAEAQGPVERFLTRRFGPLVRVPSLVDAERWFRTRR